MNIGTEGEVLEFKKTTGEKKDAMDSICAMLNKHCKGTESYLDFATEFLSRQNIVTNIEQ